MVQNNEEFNMTQYYFWRAGQESQPHCTGTSCDNLVAMYTEHQVPENVADKDVDHEAPDSVSPRPGRSEPLQSDFYAVAAFSEYLDDSEGGAAQVAVTAAPAYVAADYYTELRRRSLEGRPDVESLASEAGSVGWFGGALY